MDRPLRTSVVTGADANIFTKPTFFANYTICNASGAGVTVNFYDIGDTSATNALETVVIPAGNSFHGRPKVETLIGLNVKASLWTSLTVSVRWAPR